MCMYNVKKVKLLIERRGRGRERERDASWEELHSQNTCTCILEILTCQEYIYLYRSNYYYIHVHLSPPPPPPPPPPHRVVQWRHQVLRRKGYLKFYRKMRNVRRVPFIIVSLINAVILLFVSLLYLFKVDECNSYKGLHSVDFLYMIVGMELVLTLPCLIYYIGVCVCVCV